jgi:hypothetical protein
MMPCRLSKDGSALWGGGGNWSFCIQDSPTTGRRVEERDVQGNFRLCGWLREPNLAIQSLLKIMHLYDIRRKCDSVTSVCPL